MAHEVFIPDGSFDFSGGVNSACVPTVRSALVTSGLRRDQTAWLVNATCRGGGILQRAGWQPNTRVVSSGFGLYQIGLMYQPIDDSNPYWLLMVGGHIMQVFPDTGVVIDLSAKFGLFMPPTVDQGFALQAEEFAIFQAGDGVTLPLFWDNVKLRRSMGLRNPLVAPGTPGVNEIPAATAMDYYMNRIFYAQGRTVSAGDIVKGPSGTAQYSKRDSILEVTENPLSVGGDGFTIPSGLGNIRAIKHNAQLDATLGQGQLFFFTRKVVVSQYVPVARSTWISTGNAASGNTNMPLQTVALLNNGSVNDRGVVNVNGDLFFQSLEPSIRSLFLSTRYFQQWGNVPISRNINRLLRFNNRALMRFASGIYFDNRLWQTALPQLISPFGVTHQTVAPLDFDIISNFEEEKIPPAWEGHYEGLDILQLFVGDFGGLERAFAAAVSRIDGSLEMWELTISSRTENGDNRVVWSMDFPAFTWGKEFELKQIHAAEVWVDKEFGSVDMQLNFRPDADPCWRLWGETQFCAARNCQEDVTNPVCYPGTPQYREGYCFPVTFGSPPDQCANATCWVKRPASVGFQIQPQLVMKGWARIRGIILWASMVDRGLYEDFGSCLPTGTLLTPRPV